MVVVYFHQDALCNASHQHQMDLHRLFGVFTYHNHIGFDFTPYFTYFLQCYSWILLHSNNIFTIREGCERCWKKFPYTLYSMKKLPCLVPRIMGFTPNQKIREWSPTKEEPTDIHSDRGRFFLCFAWSRLPIDGLFFRYTYNGVICSKRTSDIGICLPIIFP